MYFHFFDLPEYYLQNLAYLIKQQNTLSMGLPVS